MCQVLILWNKKDTILKEGDSLFIRWRSFQVDTAPGVIQSGDEKAEENLLFMWNIEIEVVTLGFPGGAVVENLPANAGDAGSSPGLGRSHMPRSN